MRKTRGTARLLAVAAVLTAGCATACSGGTGATHPDGRPSSAAPAAPRQSAAADTSNQDPAHYAPQVIKHAREAGVSPRLVMAILYNEDYKPHDPSLERSWQKIKPDSAFGIANMHKAAFDQTKQGRSFAHRDWQELPDDPDLAITAESWFLHDLAAQLPAHWAGPYTKDQLLALGYNAGAGNMAAFARGATPGSAAGSYLDRLKENWDKAGKAVARAG
ncbi:transglycosylase SLT domain-containing protein [Streptomyces orinoci]|uniref:Transglycosylase SLT domain-containing protein n=1 Tax=Streptomyces orinoci TaxID=67339 RepID=A0ABV3JWX3_STRON|nr:transglycosylase SLT domain-containing protein [Streptomyces orinoci]